MSSLEPITRGTEVPTAALPPLIAAALRLEKSLASSSGKHSDLYYSYPAKVVRRWLSTSSGAASGASAGEITQAALSLVGEAGTLDPLLLEYVAEEDTAMKVEEPKKEEEKDDTDAMKTDEEKEGEEKEEEKTHSVPMTKVDFLEHALLEVHVWLISLKVRLLWRQEADQSTAEKMQQLCQKGITMIQAQLQKDEIDTKSASLFPLLARLWRWLVLVTPAGSLRVEMAKAHNMALLKRDTDTAATLLNCMLRDLLLNSQGMLQQQDASCFSFRKYFSSIVYRNILTDFFNPSLSRCFSGASTKVARQLHLSYGHGVQQPIVSISLLFWKNPSAAIGVHEQFWQLEPIVAEGAHEYGIGFSYCCSAPSRSRTITYGGNSGSPSLFYKGNEARTPSLLGNYTSCSPRRFGCIYQGCFDSQGTLAEG